MVKNNKKSLTRKLGNKRWFFIILCLVFVAVVLPPSMHKIQIKLNKENLQNNTQTVRTRLSSPGKVIYNEQRDNGCQTNDSGWLGQTTSCTISGGKFFANEGDIETDLRHLQTQLQNMGYSFDKTGLSTIEYENLISGKSSTRSWTYKSSEYPTVRIMFYNPKTDRENIKDRLQMPIPNGLTDQTYIYGVYIGGTYDGKYGW